MKYSNQLRNQKLVKGHGVLSFAKKMGESIGKKYISKNLSGKFSQKVHAKQFQSVNCIISTTTKVTTSEITELKLFFLIFTFSTEDNAKLL